MNCLTAMVITKKDGAGFIIKTKGLKAWCMQDYMLFAVIAAQ